MLSCAQDRITSVKRHNNAKKPKERVQSMIYERSSNLINISNREKNLSNAVKRNEIR